MTESPTIEHLGEKALKALNLHGVVTCPMGNSVISVISTGTESFSEGRVFPGGRRRLSLCERGPDACARRAVGLPGRARQEVGVRPLSCEPWCLRLAQADGLLASSSVSVREGLLGPLRGGAPSAVATRACPERWCLRASGSP